jgi:hypothetical protein
MGDDSFFNTALANGIDLSSKLLDNCEITFVP